MCAYIQVIGKPTCSQANLLLMNKGWWRKSIEREVINVSVCMCTLVCMYSLDSPFWSQKVLSKFLDKKELWLSSRVLQNNMVSSVITLPYCAVFIYFFFLWVKVSQCSSETCYVEHAGLELRNPPTLPPEHWDWRHALSYPIYTVFLKIAESRC